MFTLNINNFRGFTKEDINLSKLNVLIGENSGGKSSFIKFLLLLKQSMETPSKDRKINVDGHLIDLGSYDKFIKYNSKEKSFEFTLKTDEEYLNYYIYFMDISDDKLDEFVKKFQYLLKEKVELTFTFKKEDNDFFTNYINIKHKNIGSISIEIENKKNEPFSDMEDIQANLVIKHNKYNEIVIKNKMSIHGFLMLADPDSIIKYGKDKNIPDFIEEIAFLLLSQNYLWTFLKNIKYMNPIKFEPTRILLKRDNSSLKNITDYESLINVLTYLKDSKEQKSKEILKSFNEALKEIGIAEQIKLETNDFIPVAELIVKVSGNWNSIVDVGYGVGLQIPIILQAIISSYKEEVETIIIEQPEIHLHPALHAKFIDVLLKYSKNTRIIIETHSEHIIRKIQVLVKKEVINPKEINIYYFKNRSGKFHISKHELLKNGKLEPIFPEGFYDNSYNLSKELY